VDWLTIFVLGVFAGVVCGCILFYRVLERTVEKGNSFIIDDIEYRFVKVDKESPNTSK
jgi:hypothetical protein